MNINMNAWCWSAAHLPALRFAGIILIVLLGLATRTVAQNENSDDPASVTREEWKARVDAAKARIQQMRREGEPFIPPADGPMKRILQDSTLVYGDIVVTEGGVFEFIGATAGPHNREEFRQIDRDKALLPR